MTTSLTRNDLDRTPLAVAATGLGDDLADLMPIWCDNSSFHWDGDVPATAVISYDIVNCLDDHTEARMCVCDSCAVPALRQIRSHHGNPFTPPSISDLPKVDRFGRAA